VFLRIQSGGGSLSRRLSDFTEVGVLLSFVIYIPTIFMQVYCILYTVALTSFIIYYTIALRDAFPQVQIYWDTVNVILLFLAVRLNVSI
jgi:hypothetical protein